MKRIKIIMLLMLLLSIANQLNAQTKNPSLTPAEFKALSEKTKGVIIDVRNKNEFDFAHIPNAVQIGVESEDFTIQIDSLDKSKSYFVYCGMGKRSATAISIMQKEGFKNVFGLKGGFLEWKKQELPVVKHK
jgi:phage shock protein E